MSALDLALSLPVDAAAGLLSLLAPRTCAACRGHLPPAPRVTRRDRAWDALLCPSCRRATERIGAACRACGAPRPPYADPAPRCRACERRPKGAVEATIALLRYRRGARRLLHRVKYGGREDACAPLGRALAARVLDQAAPLHRDLVVVAVPLHPWRRWSRGFNQAERIAEALVEALERPLVPALVRARRTPALYGVRREARDAVVAGAFRARAPLGGRPVLLIDDIRTSGATLRAAAAALKDGGAGPITAAVVAR